MILAIETSCDETSVAILEPGGPLRAHIVMTQMATHQKFGGVVPEIASREHVQVFPQILDYALTEANISDKEIKAVAVTQGPGLVGALLIGITVAKSLALGLNVPLIGTHHIAGHIYANALEHSMQYPCMALVVSGGHTELVYLPKEGVFEKIGQTRDDAVGEAYDKVARALKFPYPGGPKIDQLACEADEEIKFPRSFLEPDSYDFSFSGLKSAVLNVVNQAQMAGEAPMFASIAKGFQSSVIEVLVKKSIAATKQYGAKQLIVCGGVAANQGLRSALTKKCAEENIPLFFPSIKFCTDNAAMIAKAAELKWNVGQFSSLDMQAEPLMSLVEWSTEKHELY